MQPHNKQISIFNIAVIVAALGYFVDIYDLLLFTIVKAPSVKAVGATDLSLLADSTRIINWQMTGLLLGGVIWGILGDKKGRLSVLFGSITIYSIANFATGYVETVNQYALWRFIAGLGLAGELGAGITLVAELLPKEKRGLGTSLVAGIGLSGAIAAYYTFKLSHEDWRLCYKLGGGLGVLLLLLRIKVAESGMYKSLQHKNVRRGNFLMFFANRKRFFKYVLAIGIGLPTWYAIGILINQSDKFGKEFFGSVGLDSGRSIMFSYIGTSIGGTLIGFVSHYFNSRKKALLSFYVLNTLAVIFYFSPLNHSNDTMYAACFFLGFATGYWAIFVTMGAEQFGTNLRATAATTIPNMVRGSLPLMNMLFKDLFLDKFKWNLWQSGLVTGAVVLTVTFVSFYFTEETYHKDLDYLETEALI